LQDTVITDLAAQKEGRKYFQPGIWPGTRLLRISGLNPLGVAGAASYMTSAPGLEEFARALGNPARLPDKFEAVLQVDCLKGQVSTVRFARGGV
jgi:hypothetical protein